jgi:hypothetical protein
VRVLPRSGLLVAAWLSLVPACGRVGYSDADGDWVLDAAEPASDTGAMDTGAGDVGAIDSAAIDSAPIDSAAVDSAAIDGVPVDAPVAPDAWVEEPPRVTADPIAWWSFDDAADDGQIDDLSGHGSHAVCPIATRCPLFVPGRFGGAARFDGVDDALRVPDSGLFAIVGGVTLSAWTQLAADAHDGINTVVSKAVFGGTTSDPGSYWLSLERPSGWARVRAEYTALTFSDALPPETWTHLAATWDGTAFVFYVNGLRVAETALAEIRTTGDSVIIGAHEDRGVLGDFFAGTIDELRIYDQALSAADVAVLAGR